MSLTFNELRVANATRVGQFRNGRGQLAHNADGSDWSPCDWMTALTGEVGEAANLIKKVRRGDFDLDEVRGDLADELADIACYLDLLARSVGVDLGEATRSKFNRVSDRVGSPVKL